MFIHFVVICMVLFWSFRSKKLAQRDSILHRKIFKIMETKKFEYKEVFEENKNPQSDSIPIETVKEIYSKAKLTKNDFNYILKVIECSTDEKTLNLKQFSYFLYLIDCAKVYGYSLQLAEGLWSPEFEETQMRVPSDSTMQIEDLNPKARFW